MLVTMRRAVRYLTVDNGLIKGPICSKEGHYDWQTTVTQTALHCDVRSQRVANDSACVCCSARHTRSMSTSALASNTTTSGG